ncbi:MAG: hypothetical protein EPN86_01545 [Nanoarchaeota archaeon]|nr:MAG: hypothetical protein EPN86_01545 [Nanoarchaeota archaeon]
MKVRIHKRTAITGGLIIVTGILFAASAYLSQTIGQTSMIVRLLQIGALSAGILAVTSLIINFME